MPTNLPTDQRFYITRHTANLIEDLERQFRATIAICVVYGIKGVGKSSLVRQFVATRLPDTPKTLLSFEADGTCFNAESVLTGAQQDILQQTLAQLETGSMLILDHFEFAQREASMQLFDWWKKNASEKKLGLIIITTHQELKSLSELSSQSNLVMNSVELKPMAMQDRLEFIAVRTCRDPTQFPRLPARVKALVKQSNGLFPALEQIVSEHGPDIPCAKKRMSYAFKIAQFVIPLVLLVILVQALLPERQLDKVEVQPSRNSLDDTENTIIAPLPLSANPVQEIPNTTEQMPITNVADTVEPELAAELAQQPVEQSADLAAATLSKESGTQEFQDQSATIDTWSEPLEAEIDAELNILQQRLRKTEQWLNENDPLTASLQIMTLTDNTQPEQALIRYLERLLRQGINLDNILVYLADNDNSQVYGVLYGRYASRAQALEQMKHLPAALKADKPIPRTVKGIKQEIK